VKTKGAKTLSKEKQRQKNELVHYRRRLRFSQERVAALLGQKRRGLLWEYESGTILPSLPVALRLAAVYRAPVEFLFRDLFLGQQQQVRELEETKGANMRGELHQP
jgi:transcriptional regulator with XRE-family HTH domain